MDECNVDGSCLWMEENGLDGHGRGYGRIHEELVEKDED